MEGASQNGMMTSAAAEVFNDNDSGAESWLKKAVDDLTSESTLDDLENAANALGPEVGVPFKAGEEIALGGVRLAEEAKSLISYWPENDGFLGEAGEEILQPGTMIDRYGEPAGQFAAPQGTLFEMKALPGNASDYSYYVYRVMQPLTVRSGLTAPSFGRIGLGTQYKFQEPIQSLIDNGFLK